MAMNPNVVREADERTAALVHSPAFLTVAGALPGLYVATTLENGIAIGVAAAVSIIVSAVLARVLSGVTGLFSKAPVVLVLDAMVLILLGFALRVTFPVIFEALGIYLPITSVAGAAAVFAAQDGLTTGAGSKELTLVDAVFAAVAACVALVVCGLLGELLGSASVAGVSVGALSSYTISIFGKPTGDLLLLALVAVVVQAVCGRGKDGAAEKEGER